MRGNMSPLGSMRGISKRFMKMINQEFKTRNPRTVCIKGTPGPSRYFHKWYAPTRVLTAYLNIFKTMTTCATHFLLRNNVWLSPYVYKRLVECIMEKSFIYLSLKFTTMHTKNDHLIYSPKYLHNHRGSSLNLICDLPKTEKPLHKSLQWLHIWSYFDGLIVTADTFRYLFLFSKLSHLQLSFTREIDDICFHYIGKCVNLKCLILIYPELEANVFKSIPYHCPELTSLHLHSVRHTDRFNRICHHLGIISHENQSVSANCIRDFCITIGSSRQFLLCVSHLGIPKQNMIDLQLPTQFPNIDVYYPHITENYEALNLNVLAKRHFHPACTKFQNDIISNRCGNRSKSGHKMM
jgi:hypothetical protein